MVYEIVTETAAARPIAAVRRRVAIGEVSPVWRPALDRVWAFLRRHPGLRTGGHNIFVYHHPTRLGDPMEVDFGVEVSGAFASEEPSSTASRTSRSPAVIVCRRVLALSPTCGRSKTSRRSSPPRPA